MTKLIRLKIKRQDKPDSQPYWDDFELMHKPGMNVIAALMQIQKRPITADDRAVPPVAWDSGCLEELCGACTMIINGKVLQACGALIDTLEDPIRIEPMTKFPVVRDLCVDRSRLDDSMQRVAAWVTLDGTLDLGPGPRISQREQIAAYDLSRCTTCGACLEACPQYNERSVFIGAAAISQARLFNAHPTGALQSEGRLDSLMGEGGLSDCGNAQNCVKACPLEIPLTVSIAEMGRQMTRHAFKKVFG